MNKKFKKIISSLLPLVLALVFVAGTFEVGEMLGTPGVASYVLGSDGDYTPPTPTPTPSPTPAKKKAKKANPMTVKGKTVEILYTKVSKKTQYVTRKKAMAINKAKGKVTYKKKSGNSKITINKSTGKITVKKGIKRGTYKLKVKVTAAGTSSYKKKTLTRTVTIKVVKAANPMTVTATDLTIDSAELVNDAKVIPVSSAVTVKGAEGAVTYAKTSGDEGITVDEASGDITVAKGLAPGVYALEITVKAAGNSKYSAGTKYAEIAVFVNESETPAPETPAPETGE